MVQYTVLYVRRLIWDSWNVTHIARHQVILDEVEQVCHGPHIIREAYKGRVMVIGPTTSQRMLAVVLELQPGEDGYYYPIAARPASRLERRQHRAEKEGETL